jgi:diaminopimelate epimerase
VALVGLTGSSAVGADQILIVELPEGDQAVDFVYRIFNGRRR